MVPGGGEWASGGARSGQAGGTGSAPYGRSVDCVRTSRGSVLRIQKSDRGYRPGTTRPRRQLQLARGVAAFEETTNMTVPADSATQQVARASNGQRPKAAPLLGGLLILVSLATIAATVVVSAYRALSPLENTLFAAISFTLSIFGSVLISAHYSRSSARQEYQQLARPALRRIVALYASTGRVNSYVDQRAAAADEGDRDWLAGLDAQMHLLLDQMGAAISDWRELLPEDYEEAVVTAVDMRQIAAKVAELERVRTEEGEASQAQIDQLTAEIGALKTKVAARSSAGALLTDMNGEPWRVKVGAGEKFVLGHIAKG